VTSNLSKNVDIKPNLPASITHLRGLDLTTESATCTVSKYAEKLFQDPFCWLHSVGDFWYHKSIEATPVEEAVSMIMSHYITLYATSKAIIPVMSLWLEG
jgi:hypothetical protein